MRNRTTKKTQSKSMTPAAKTERIRHEHEAEASVAGALVGAALGAFGGPPGAAAGAVIGGIVGAVATGVAEKNAADRATRDGELDAAIGVIGGDLGAPNLAHPPARTGAYSMASAGARAVGASAPPAGPMQSPDA